MDPKPNFKALDGRFEFRDVDAGVVLAAKTEVWQSVEMRKAAAAAEAKAAAAAGAGSGSGSSDKKRTGNKRLIEASSGKIEEIGRVGGEFSRMKSPEWLDERVATFDELLAAEKERVAAMPETAIVITLPDGATRDGIAYKTTPLEIAIGIAKSLAKKAIVASIKYTSRVGDAITVLDVEEEEDAHQEMSTEEGYELWDLNRPLEGNCNLVFKTYEHPEGQMVFKHSSAHILGAALEAQFGVKLCIGPPTEDGFYYDAYMGQDAIKEDPDYKSIEGAAKAVIKAKHKFERLTLTKDQALHLFRHNPFKVQLIKNKVPDGAFTSAYKCGHLIDLCMGPHLPNTNRVVEFAVTKNSAAYWLANADNDSLQRVYGVAFPDKKMMKQYKLRVAEAKKRDHRVLGQQQELFFFHELSPGSCFFLPRGAHMYNKLIDFIKSEYHKRGYSEVVTPNVFHTNLWKKSGHYEHYKDDMFIFEAEGQEFGLKPMNCPGHCLMFQHRVRSHRELPLRLADFGVLHRNEASGALSGLTRVRRFQQDDAHIFCRVDQIQQEVRGVLEFMKAVYGVFGFEFKLFLSTRPKKAMGEVEVWNEAERMMTNALNAFGHKWFLNPGDGAFYGPKIDIQVFDAMGRAHQCATIQLDFQLPIRFELNYSGDEQGVNPRPVIVHRAILGSVERLMGVLTEHTAGKWPFWISPRQACVVPVAATFYDFAQNVRDGLHAAGFVCDVNLSSKTFNKKVRTAQTEQYNCTLVVGEREAETDSVTVRVRGEKRAAGAKTVDEVLAWFKEMDNKRV